MLITSARVDPVTSGPVLVANGPSSARSCRRVTVVTLAAASVLAKVGCPLVARWGRHS
jgi:hypothetical protein